MSFKSTPVIIALIMAGVVVSLGCLIVELIKQKDMTRRAEIDAERDVELARIENAHLAGRPDPQPTRRNETP